MDETIPAIRPYAILNVKGINAIVRKAGTASTKSLQLIPCADRVIKTPTAIKAGPVAYAGIAVKMGEKNNEHKKNKPVTMAVIPVRPPSRIPDADSESRQHSSLQRTGVHKTRGTLPITVVTGEVPINAPAVVARASQVNVAFSPSNEPSGRRNPANFAILYNVPVVSS